jgi:response regulator RpfG family c-di-GMP phosphodiesterase
MSETPLPRILCVDDEPHVLEGLGRYLRRRYDLVTAVGGAAGAEAVQRDPGFAAVVSDLRMPKVDGVAFLAHARKVAPDAVRILLTGQADVKAAMAAVNEGRIFRFLSKPCAPEVMLQTLDAAVEQHRLVTAERVLLEQTLHGSIKALTEVLALANPAAFGRSTRAKRLVSDLAAMIGIRDRWQFEVAAMLSQIGCITLPPATVEKHYRGQELSDSERALVDRLPQVAVQLIADIPRLDGIREILIHQHNRFRPPGLEQVLRGDQIPLGSRMLKVALDFDELRSQGHASADVLTRLRAREGWYDPDVLQDFAQVAGVNGDRDLREIRLCDVKVGMTFEDDVLTKEGTLLIARGQEATPSLVDRIDNYWQDVAITEPVRVTVPREIVAAGSAGGP